VSDIDLRQLAHDIRGPLTAIIGFAELIEEGALEGEEAQDAARTIRTNAERLAALANELTEKARAARDGSV
jgi:signal transduction histidine kinase